MKVKVLKEAYYNDRLVKPNEIIEFKEDKLPSWAVKCCSKSNKNNDENKPLDKVGQDNSETNTPPVITENDENNPLDKVGQNENDVKINDAEKEQYLEKLLNDGIEKGILIDDADKKNIDEQIKELEIALNKVNNEGE